MGGTSKAALVQELGDHALAKEGAEESWPWGHLSVKVKGRTFVFLHAESGKLSVSVKLAASHEGALDEPFASPTGYGLGKSGWVTARFEEDDPVPMNTLRAWIDESYALLAPKPRRVAEAPAARKTPAKKAVEKTAARKPAAQKAPAKKTARARKAPSSGG